MGAPPGNGKAATIKKKERPGEQFEEAFRNSLKGIDGVYVRRLRTPTAMGFMVPKLVGLVIEMSRILGRPVEEWVTKAARFRFTPKAGFDFLVTAPAGVRADRKDPNSPWIKAPEVALPGVASIPGAAITYQPSIFFALELKSVDGVSVPHSNVDDDQESALVEAAASGHLAFFVVEFRGVGEVWAVPIQAWCAVRAVSSRKSLPVEDARRVGMRIWPDKARGRGKPYWMVKEWLRACGAVINDF